MGVCRAKTGGWISDRGRQRRGAERFTPNGPFSFPCGVDSGSGRSFGAGEQSGNRTVRRTSKDVNQLPWGMSKCGPRLRNIGVGQRCWPNDIKDFMTARIPCGWFYPVVITSPNRRI